MGFAKKSRREAQAAQVAALNQQNQILQHTQQQNAQYQQGFDTRNAGVIKIRDRGNKFLDDYSKGTDIADLIPASVKMAQQTSDTVKNTITAAGRQGDASQLRGDKSYQDKLNSSLSAKLGKGMAAINDERLHSEVGQQTENVFNASNFLNSDAQAGLGLNTQAFGMANSIFSNATTRREMEIQRSNIMMNNLMQGLSGGVQGFLTATGAGGAFSAGGAFGG